MGRSLRTKIKRPPLPQKPSDAALASLAFKLTYINELSYYRVVQGDF